MLIVALCGKMGSGKDHVAHTVVLPLLRRLGLTCVHLCFADQIKVNAMVKHGLRPDDVLDAKTRETRALLQREGTELGRDVLGQDVWVRYFDAWLAVHRSRGVDAVVTTDVRFRNEAEYVRHHKDDGILIRIDAPERNARRLRAEGAPEWVRLHRSECDLDHYDDVDFVVRNDECVDESDPHHTSRLRWWLRQRLAGLA